jgi:hypothetical protein
MGNQDIIKDILLVASAAGSVEDRIETDIVDMCNKVQLEGVD